MLSDYSTAGVPDERDKLDSGTERRIIWVRINADNRRLVPEIAITIGSHPQLDLIN
ncbi:hypothetical protein PGT21_014213 [Puccinia graminis f. sp. tritici]|uniref:Uncharacterized protein n=1 Tax=Puccinia graminis f. sp. tritici TaxID=56615 RepID=A0A5B0MF49_PUCGR|nr:hypothetical protein PGT21_014213 [Puccinia graminis f. sp. tritici]KAA1115939.1 hypothetical protein PGTUg99_023634 [Puccinia graminis f. sp. tritici]